MVEDKTEDLKNCDNDPGQPCSNIQLMGRLKCVE
jgi:hypothetical protein